MPISLSLQLRDDLNSSEVDVSGFDLKALDDQSASVFGIPRQIVGKGSDSALWDAIRNWWGRPPDEFVTSDPVRGSHAHGVPSQWTPYADSWGAENQVRVEQKAVGVHLIETTGGVDSIVTANIRNYNDEAMPGQEAELTYNEDVEDTRYNENSAGMSLTNGMEVTVGGEFAGFKGEAKRISIAFFALDVKEKRKKMDDIYNVVYKKVHDQCLKLLDPDSDAFALHQPTLSAEELEVLEPRFVKDVRSGSPDLANINQRTTGQQFPLPILFLEIGTGGLDFLHPSIVNAMKGEAFFIKIRCVVDKPSITDGYSYENSAPVKLLKQRSQLDYLLDISVFRGLRSERIGYDFPSLIWDCGIMATEALEGLPASYDAIDWRFVAEIHKQKLRGN